MNGANAQPRLLGTDALSAAACLGVVGTEICTLEANDAEKCILEGRQLLGQKRTKRAIQKFRKATRLAPQCAPAWNDLGVAIYMTGKPRQAIRHFLMALDLDNSFVDSVMNLSQIFQELHQPVEAIPFLKRLLEFNPDNREASKHLETLAPIQTAANKAAELTKKGRHAVTCKEFNDAIRYFVLATQAYPGCVPAWNDLGVTLYENNQAEAALEAFAHALKLNPAFADSALNMASLYANANCHAKGIPPLKKALSEDPENSEIQRALHNLLEDIKTSNLIEHHIFEGRKYMRNGEFLDAVKEYREALDIDESCYIAHNDLGVAFWSANQPEESIACLKQALSFKPGFIDAAINLASIFASLDRHDEAIPFLTEAAGIHPDSPELKEQLENFAPENIVQHQVEVLVQRGRELVDQYKMEQAIQCFVAATELDSSCAAAWSDLGVSLASIDKIKTSIESFERALRADRHYLEAALNLATVYVNIEQHSSSVTILEKALLDNPESPELKEALKISLAEIA